MASSTVPAKSPRISFPGLATGLLSMLQSSICGGNSESSLSGPIGNQVIQPKCKSPSQGFEDFYPEDEKTLFKCGKKSRNLVQKIKRKGVSSCNQEDKKNIRSSTILIKLPSPTEKKIAEEDEKQIDNLDYDKPAARTWNSRPRRKTNSKYASSVLEENYPDTFESEKGKKSEFTNSLTREEIEEDYFYLMGKPLRRTKKKRVR